MKNEESTVGTGLLSDIDIASFKRNGFLIMRGLSSHTQCDDIRRVTGSHLESELAPLEYEAEVQYPGAPKSMDVVGGHTVRRLLHAYARDSVFRQWAGSDAVKGILRRLFGIDASGNNITSKNAVQLSQSHHNCVMTKSPGYSSETLWHQDNRYWSFDEENLISVWLALGDESIDNGCLRIVPGSHAMSFDSGQFDASLFLRVDLAKNKAIIKKAEDVELNKGDVLFFHSRLFHAAGRNQTESTKFSLVFTYHLANNYPIKGTRSAKFQSIDL